MGTSQSQLLQMGDSGDIDRPLSASAKSGDDHDPSILDRLHNIDGDSDNNHDPTGDYDLIIVHKMRITRLHNTDSYIPKQCFMSIKWISK